MNILRFLFRPLLATSVLGAAALLAVGCGSSKETPVPAGGAIWQMQGAACQDRTAHKLALSTTDEAGKPVDRLLSDGSDGARVRCQIDATHFSVAVSTSNGGLIANGSISGKTSTNTKLTISLPIGTYSSPSATPCALDIVTNDGSNFIANIACTELDNTALSSDSCSISPLGASVVSYFSFQNCGGF